MEKYEFLSIIGVYIDNDYSLNVQIVMNLCLNLAVMLLKADIWFGEPLWTR